MVRNYHAQLLGMNRTNKTDEQSLSSFGKFIKSGTIRTSDGRYINYGGAFAIGSQHLPSRESDSDK